MLDFILDVIKVAVGGRLYKVNELKPVGDKPINDLDVVLDVFLEARFKGIKEPGFGQVIVVAIKLVRGLGS